MLVALIFPTAPITAARTLVTLLLVRRALWLPMLIILPAVPALPRLRYAVVLAALITTPFMTLIAAPVMALLYATVVVVVTRLWCRQVATLVMATIIVTALRVTVVTIVMPRGDIHRVALHPIVAVRIIVAVIARVTVTVAIHRTTG